MPEEQRWTLTKTVLADATLADEDRLAAGLVLLYGQTAQSIVQLRRDDVQTHTTSKDQISGQGSRSVTTLRLGRDPLELIEPLDQLARNLAAASRDQGGPGGLSRAFDTDPGWLFHGRGPDKPLGAEALRRRLVRLGIHAREGRNTALLTLARDTPPSVLADLLGVSTTTADRFRDVAAGSWTGYLAARRNRPWLTAESVMRTELVR